MVESGLVVEHLRHTWTDSKGNQIRPTAGSEWRRRGPLGFKLAGSSQSGSENGCGGTWYGDGRGTAYVLLYAPRGHLKILHHSTHTYCISFDYIRIVSGIDN